MMQNANEAKVNEPLCRSDGVENKSDRLKVLRGSDLQIGIKLDWVSSTTREGAKDEEATAENGKAKH